MANNIQYTFSVTGNFPTTIEYITQCTEKFTEAVKRSTDGICSWQQKFATFGLVGEYFEKVNSAIKSFSASGATLDSKMHELSAIAGVVGDDLNTIERYARNSAKEFGIDASQAVESYKLLLSQLSPELGKYPEALQAMGRSIATTSKLMGGDGVAAAEVLTTAMNQYGVSLEDPMKASAEMARMMNVMAAAGQAGSAELPAIKLALQQCGMAAKAASVSFEETNAAIQVLDKAGRKGAEGGISLRNVLTTLSRGRFLPKQTQEELTQAGIDIQLLSDKTVPLKDRLESLKPVLNDDALLSAFFGRENANAARALIQGTDALGQFTEAVTGTASAEEQASIIMDSYSEKMAQIQSKIENIKISLFESTRGASLWISGIGEMLIPLSQLWPLLQGAWGLMKKIADLPWAKWWTAASTAVRSAWGWLTAMNGELAMGKVTTKGFMTNIVQATLAVGRFATVGIFNGLKALGAFILSLFTSGAASKAFAATARAAFNTFKTSAVTACTAVKTAIFSIPIIGWITIAITLIVGLGTYFWKTSVTFRAVLKGIWAAFKATFTGIGNLAQEVFGAIGDLIRACFHLDHKGITEALNRLKSGFTDYGRSISEAFSNAYNAEIKSSEEKKGEEGAEGNDIIGSGSETPVFSPVSASPYDPTAGTLSGVGSGASGGGKISNVTVNVEKLVERFEITTNNLANDMSRVKDMVSEALLSALNDVNLAV